MNESENQRKAKEKATARMKLEPRVGRQSDSEDGQELSSSKTGARVKGGKQATARMKKEGESARMI